MEAEGSHEAPVPHESWAPRIVRAFVNQFQSAADTVRVLYMNAMYRRTASIMFSMLSFAGLQISATFAKIAAKAAFPAFLLIEGIFVPVIVGCWLVWWVKSWTALFRQSTSSRWGCRHFVMLAELLAAMGMVASASTVLLAVLNMGVAGAAAAILTGVGFGGGLIAYGLAAVCGRSRPQDWPPKKGLVVRAGVSMLAGIAATIVGLAELAKILNGGDPIANGLCAVANLLLVILLAKDARRLSNAMKKLDDRDGKELNTRWYRMKGYAREE